jgi:hypothetical protein
MNYLIVLTIAYLVAMAVDWRQTLAIFCAPARWREINPLIRGLARACPTPAVGVHVWFAFWAVAVPAAFWLGPVPDGLSLVLFSIATAAEVIVVVYNYLIGLRA